MDTRHGPNPCEVCGTFGGLDVVGLFDFIEDLDVKLENHGGNLWEIMGI